jgi:hypothetical protein
MWCSSPLNKFTFQVQIEDLEKNAVEYKKKAGNDNTKGGVKQNQVRKEKYKATKQPIGKRKREATVIIRL